MSEPKIGDAPAYAEPADYDTGTREHPDDKARAARVRSHTEGWTSGMVEGVIHALAHFRETTNTPDDKALAGERVLVRELRRRFGDRRVDEMLTRYHVPKR